MLSELEDGAKSGEEVDAVVDWRRESVSPCCSISVQIPTISVIMLRMASAVLLSPATAGAGSGAGSVKKLLV